MIITDKTDVFQKLLKDVEDLKIRLNPYAKYYAGCDPIEEKQTLFKEGQWVKRTVGKDIIGRETGRVFKIARMEGSQVYDDSGFTHFLSSLRLATKEEIKEQLVREAVRKGFVAYSRFKWEGKGERDDITTIMPHYGYEYFSDLDCLVVEVKESTSRRAIYRNGTWAIPVVENKLPRTSFELEQILREFGRAVYASDYLGEMNNEIEKFMRKKGYREL